MKSRILKTSIGSIIFLLLVIAVIALIFPTYKKINAAVSVGVLKITQKIEEKGYMVESCKVMAHISKTDSGIEKISLKIAEKTTNSGDEKQSEDSIENKMVTEIKKIQSVDISIGSKQQEKESNIQESTNITKTDIKIIKDFLIKEYEVNENCLKIS